MDIAKTIVKPVISMTVCGQCHGCCCNVYQELLYKTDNLHGCNGDVVGMMVVDTIVGVVGTLVAMIVRGQHPGHGRGDCRDVGRNF